MASPSYADVSCLLHIVDQYEVRMYVAYNELGTYILKLDSLVWNVHPVIAATLLPIK